MSQESPPFYVPVGTEMQVFGAAFQQGLSVMLKGPTGCGKTRFVEADGARPRSPADYRGLSRRLDDRRSCWPVPPARRRNRLGRRSAHSSGPGGRHLLSGRDRRSPSGHHCRPPSTGGLSPSASHGTTRRDPGRGIGILPRRVVQPGLPERFEGSEGLDPSAHGGHRARLSTGGCGGEDLWCTRLPSTRSWRPSWCGSEGRSDGSRHRGCAKSRRRGCSLPRLSSSPPAWSCATRHRAAIAGPLTDDPIVTAGLFEMIDAYVTHTST